MFVTKDGTNFCHVHALKKVDDPSPSVALTPTTITHPMLVDSHEAPRRLQVVDGKQNKAISRRDNEDMVESFVVL